MLGWNLLSLKKIHATIKVDKGRVTEILVPICKWSGMNNKDAVLMSITAVAKGLPALC